MAVLTHDAIGQALADARRLGGDAEARAALPLGLGGRLSALAGEFGEREALVCGADRRTFAELDRHANRLARALQARGVAAQDLVAIALANGVRFVELAAAAWKLGATAFPLSYRYPPHERDEILALAAPRLTVTDGSAAAPVDSAVDADVLWAEAEQLSDAGLPDTPTTPWKAVPSGGSTGRPKLIVARGDNGPITTANGALFGVGAGGRALIPAPLYHNGPFAWGVIALMSGATLVLLERFDAEDFLRTVERERITWVYVVPTMLQRILDLPDQTRGAFDLTSLEVLLHTSAPCPPWLKREAIELFGPEVVWEFYGATEVSGTMVRGDEWLARPGTVGRPFPSIEVAIRDPETSADLPAGEVGEIFLRPPGGPRFAYRGAEERIQDGFVSVGDLGHVDDDGYIYLSDRRKDLIISGGNNVYPAEIEGVLQQHPAVFDVGVIGVPDRDLGQVVHAVVQPADAAAPPAVDERVAFCRERLVGYKVPRSVAFVDALGRDPSGKLRRSLLAEGASAVASEREGA